ncbi:methyltransferase [Spongiibacter taiwanensis]|uniref:class I SAM-dependent methyltransferase n=1 Tax=Spongiibacter taiwanensis TaxID=1748242 RepID=UPI00203623FA|nr:methyltransferase [Spongiibacter taiwanensis]USA44408.1 methyltransferase [Spongiibacter taiwanensis]
MSSATDTALVALMNALSECPAPTWWFAGEQEFAPPVASGEVNVFTNRCDTAALFSDRGYPVILGDFELPSGDGQNAEWERPQSICYRVSKEKALVHYLINQAAKALPEGGELLLAGFKGDGLKTYADKAAKLLGGQKQIEKCAGNAYLARISKGELSDQWLPDQDYTRLQMIHEEPVLLSKPGIFGWQKCDRGSALLIEQLPGVLASCQRAPHRLLDLGCGYGYLTVMAHRHLPGSEWLLTDNNATALIAAQANCERHGIAAETLLADCGSGAQGPFDMVLCNPPFHQGFAVEGSLTDQFLAAASQVLARGGQALFVVNEFIPLERKARQAFASSELLIRCDGFCVYRLIAR